MEFSRQEYWTGLPFPSPGDLPDPGIKPPSPALQTDFLPSDHQGSQTMSNKPSIREVKENIVRIYIEYKKNIE